MSMTRSEPGRYGLALLLLFGGLLGAAPAPDDAEWRKKALDLNAITGDDAANGELLALLKDPATGKKVLQAAAELAKDKKKQPFNSNATLILARVAHGLKELEIARQFYQIQIEQATALESEKKMGLAYVGLIQMLYDNQKFADAQKVCQEFLEKEGDETIERLKPRVERLMVMTIVKQGQGDEALKLVDKKIQKSPDNWLNLELKARVLRELGQLDKAAKTYEDLIERIGKDKRLTKEEQQDFAGDYRYALSGVYVDLKQIDKAAEQLKTLLVKEPDNPTYNNDLGFIWADHDMNLEESEKLIRKALDDDRKQRLKENPNLKPNDLKENSAYLDSLGWVLYKQKKYKEARPYLLKAVEQEEGQHVEILDHLGDVHQALGEKDEALAVWKKAIESAGSSSREVKRKAVVEKKVKELQKDGK